MVLFERTGWLRGHATARLNNSSVFLIGKNANDLGEKLLDFIKQNSERVEGEGKASCKKCKAGRFYATVCKVEGVDLKCVKCKDSMTNGVLLA